MSRLAEPKAAALQIVCSLEAAARLRHGEGELGFDFEHIDWSHGMKLGDLTPSEIYNAETMHELASNRDQLEYIVQLIKALGSSATDLLNHYERHLDPYYAKLSRGIASLPDELLALIFKYAACSQEEGTNYAFYLSQVSRRFRRISLSDKSLWCYLFFRHNTNLQKIARSVDNCGSNCDLHIIIKDDKMVDTHLLDGFMEKCSPFASRLCSISLFGDWCDAWEYEYRYYTLAGTINQLLSCPLSMPRLRELNLTQSRHHDPDDRNHINHI
ncbi:hypothetical protein SCHPADRAFT_613739 [Schizopora paradoxa]|uniref:F-box domain-containing protein n=1 Tax=Schizopora paradoxa TaxID=27342 RepID=A0A0H2RTW8_9AGAM|nr:hypothetical protein SCHPADRAFT_613739 [Schizopora paradoxa]